MGDQHQYWLCSGNEQCFPGPAWTSLLTKTGRVAVNRFNLNEEPLTASTHPKAAGSLS